MSSDEDWLAPHRSKIWRLTRIGPQRTTTAQVLAKALNAFDTCQNYYDDGQSFDKEAVAEARKTILNHMGCE